MIYGVGIDMVDVDRFRTVMERWGERFARRVFTADELAYCLGHRRPERHLAARFAAKVSLFKALGRALPFRDVEVARGADGRPSFNVSGLDNGFTVSLSISHDGALSVAETIVERVDEDS